MSIVAVTSAKFLIAYYTCSRFCSFATTTFFCWRRTLKLENEFILTLPGIMQSRCTCSHLFQCLFCFFSLCFVFFCDAIKYSRGCCRRTDIKNVEFFASSKAESQLSAHETNDTGASQRRRRRN